MKKRILIPSNFSVQSLISLKSFLSNCDETIKYDFILLHHHELTTSISQLIFFSKTKLINQITESDFDQACDIVKNKYDSLINGITKDVFTGINQAAFNNYIDANAIDEICVPMEETHNEVIKSEAALIKLIKKSPLELIPVQYTNESESYEKGKISELFLSTISIS